MYVYASLNTLLGISKVYDIRNIILVIASLLLDIHKWKHVECMGCIRGDHWIVSIVLYPFFVSNRSYILQWVQLYVDYMCLLCTWF